MERKDAIWLSYEQRQAICLKLHRSCKDNGKPEHGLIKLLSLEYSVSAATVGRLWKQVSVKLLACGVLDVSRNLVGHVEPKEVEFDHSKLLEIPLLERTTVRSTAFKLGISATKLCKIMKKGVIKRHSSAIKPHLTEDNRRERIKFCLSKVENTSLFAEPKFIDFYDYVHVDEKWVYITKESQSYYMLPEELDPLRTCKGKRFIMKVMFLCAVARARIDCVTGHVFDGKIEIWPFTYEAPTKRGTKNRSAGTMETKPLLSITKDVYRSYLVGKLLPSLLELWLDSGSRRVIYIQQDNARPHIQVDDAEFVVVAKNIGLNIQLVCQPPNNPDMDVLDLGYFRSIEALQQKQSMNDINELISPVEKSFMELPTKNLNHVFLTIQSCMIEVLKDKGSQNYRTPHMSKSTLERVGLLPLQLSVDLDLIEASMAFLQQ